MGMFDDVNLNLDCPICGNEIKSWQTKDLENTLEKYNAFSLANKLWEKRKDSVGIHSVCEKCKEYISIVIRFEIAYSAIYVDNHKRQYKQERRTWND